MNKFLIILILPFFVSAQKTSEFKKIIYHTSMCFGRCPVYHLEIDNNRNLKLYVEHAYKTNDSNTAVVEDSSKIGYFTGKLDKVVFKELVTEFKKANPDKLEFNGVTCCDGSVTTIIAYYKGKRKFLKSMFPPEESRSLISILSRICQSGQLKRTSKKFTLEKGDDK